MSGLRDTRTFLSKGTAGEWEYVLTKYKDALRLKAQQKNKKPEELFKLDCWERAGVAMVTWYQEELPKLIQSRKEKHVTHDELVQTMKWKLSRGKWRPRLTDLVRINTPAAVTTVSKKAFRKLPNLASAVQTMSTLKGIGPATASAVLAAGAPELAPYMADECLNAIPECQAIDYTVQEYMIFTEQIGRAVERLNANTTNGVWNPHKVEKALWTFSIVLDLDPSLLDDYKAEPSVKQGQEQEEEETCTPVDTQPNSPNGNSDSQGEIQNSDESNSSEKRTENGNKKEEEVVEVKPAVCSADESSSSTVEAASSASDSNDVKDEEEEDDDEPSSKRTKTK